MQSQKIRNLGEFCHSFLYNHSIFHQKVLFFPYMLFSQKAKICEIPTLLSKLFTVSTGFSTVFVRSFPVELWKHLSYSVESELFKAVFHPVGEGNCEEFQQKSHFAVVKEENAGTVHGPCILLL